MDSTRNTHFILRAEPTSELDQLLIGMSRTASQHVDTEGPYYYVYLNKEMTVDQVKKLTGCENVVGVVDELKKTRATISTVKKGHEALVRRGKMIVDVLQEDDSPLHVLSIADRRAVRTYFNEVNDCPGRCHRGYDGQYPEENCIKNRRKKRRQAIHTE